MSERDMLTLNGIKRAGNTPIKGRKFKSFCGCKVRIWSDEHKAWWRPNASGYTTYADCAGCYDFDDAYARTRHCGPEKRIAYVRLSTPSLPPAGEG